MTVQQFDFIVNVTRSLIWQYNDATNLQSIIENKQTWLDNNVKQFWSDWYTNVYNLETANNFGLSIWAIILGVKFSSALTAQSLPFNFDGSGGYNFENGAFVPFGDVILTTSQKRTILKLRYRQLISNGTIDDIYYAMQSIFPTVSMLDDNLDMSIVMTLPIIPNVEEQYILDNYSFVLPIPAGVKIRYVTGYATYIGFDGQGVQNFYNGNFGG